MRTTTFIELYVDETSKTRVVAIETAMKDTGKALDRRYKHLKRWMRRRDGRGIAAIYQVDKPLLEARKWLQDCIA